MPASLSRLPSLVMTPNFRRKRRSKSFIERQRRQCTPLKSYLAFTLLFCLYINHSTFEIINGARAATPHTPFLSKSQQLAFAQTAPPRPFSSSSDDDDEKNKKKNPSRRRGNILPLIGPIPNTQPLIPGNSLSLNPPTPHQWKSLQESVVVHTNYYSQEKKGEKEQTTIYAAPLVLLIDDITGKTPVRLPGTKAGRAAGRYATIAAVVGLSRIDDSTKEEKEEDFLQQMMRPGGSNIDNFITPLKSSVRMVAVGRAVLKDYFYKVPSTISEEGEVGEYEEEEVHDWEKDDDYDDDGYEDKTPIVMAEFTPLIDTGIAAIDENDFGSKKSKSAMKSEVHAITELNTWVVKVNWMHENRRRLVAGLNAAKARLKLSEERMKKREEKKLEIGEETEKEVQLKKEEEEMAKSYKEFHPLYDPNMSSIENYKIILQEETKYGLLAISKRQIEDELMSVVKAPSGQSVNWNKFNILEAMLICTIKRMKEVEEQWGDIDYGKDNDIVGDISEKREIIEYDDFADYDGFGFISGGSTSVAASTKGDNESDDEIEEVEGSVEGTMTVEEFTKAFNKKRDEVYQSSKKSDDTKVQKESETDDGDIEEKELSTVAKRIANMENYGLNYYSAFSNIRDLTKVAMQTFEPYFSPLYRKREEYEFEILSFVALRALEGYVDDQHIVWALAECVSSTERLERAYQLMLQHRRFLEELAEHASDELMDCGEECSDLW